MFHFDNYFREIFWRDRNDLGIYDTNYYGFYMDIFYFYNQEKRMAQ